MLPDPKAFEREWFDVAAIVVQRIHQEPEVQRLETDFKTLGKLSFEQRSDFIAIANRVKYKVIHETYGSEGTDGFADFAQRWRYWYDHKGVSSNAKGSHRLTNEEHIVYSSTPEAEEFFINEAEKVSGKTI